MAETTGASIGDVVEVIRGHADGLIGIVVAGYRADEVVRVRVSDPTGGSTEDDRPEIRFRQDELKIIRRSEVDYEKRPYTDGDLLQGTLGIAQDVADRWREHAAKLQARIDALEAERARWMVVAPAPSPMLGGCTCYDKAPTVPVFRDRMTHLDDCPAKDSGHPVGIIPAKAPDEVPNG